VKGCGYVKIGAKDYPLKEGWAAFCFPESKHLLRSGDSSWEYRWCTVDGPFAGALAVSFQAPREPFFIGPCRTELFEALEKKLEDPSLEGERQASVEAYKFLAFMASGSSMSKSQDPSRISMLLSRISSNPGDPELTMKQLSEETGLSRFSIHRIFKAELGVSPKKYIDSLRLRKSMELLRESSMNIDEIARLVGFANANYFAKFFRKKTSFSPSQFRDSAHMP
jgi:AraC-like DNA-binding protein